MAKTLIYQMWPLSWNGLTEMTEHLNHIKELNVDYVWLGPLYLLPTYEHDEGVDGYMSIDKCFGTIKDFDDFVSAAHNLGLKVLMELSLDPIYPHPIYDTNIKWFHGYRLNRRLVRKFRKIVKFWLCEHRVDGFSLRLSPNVEDDFVCDQTKPLGTLPSYQAVEVINAIFGKTFPNFTTFDGRTPCLIMECFDPFYGNIVDYYYCYTAIDYIMNSAVRDSIDEGGLDNFKDKFARSIESTSFMLNLESPDSDRFTTRSGLSAIALAELMFESGVQNICLYQGQEIGETKPVREHISLDGYGGFSPYSMYCLAANTWKSQGNRQKRR